MNDSKRRLYATTALIIAGILGGLVPIAVKIILKEIPNFTYLFLRLTIMITILIPLSWKHISEIRRYWKYIAVLGVLWISNFILFIFGVRTTTALVSQLLTAGVPIYVLLENTFMNKEKLSKWQIIGIIIGLLGAFFIITKGSTVQSYGSIHGNTLIFLSAICSSLYLIGTKKCIKGQSPLAITASTAFVGWLVTAVLMFVFEGLRGFSVLPSVSTGVWMAVLFMGIVTGVIMWFLINIGLKYGSVIVASSMTYINILTAGVAGVFMLGEAITSHSIIGGAFLIVGIFLSTITPLLRKTK